MSEEEKIQIISAIVKKINEDLDRFGRSLALLESKFEKMDGSIERRLSRIEETPVQKTYPSSRSEPEKNIIAKVSRDFALGGDNWSIVEKAAKEIERAKSA